MFSFATRSKKAEKQFYKTLNSREDIREKLERLRENPKKELNAHKLKGKLDGKWGCYLGWDIRLVYEIDEEHQEIVVVAAGSHQEAYG